MSSYDKGGELSPTNFADMAECAIFAADLYVDTPIFLRTVCENSAFFICSFKKYHYLCGVFKIMAPKA